MQILSLLALLVVSCVCCVRAQYLPGERTNKTYLIQLATIGSWGSNETTNQYLSLARFAAWKINNQYDLLPDVELQLVVRNCGTGSGNPAQCLLAATNLVQNTSYSIAGFLTGAYTNDQRILQFVASAFNLPQVCGIASGNLLSNKHDYPTFLRTSVPDSVLDYVVVDIMYKYGWMYGLVALEDGDWGAGNRDSLQQYAVEKGIQLTFVICPTGAMNFTSQVHTMKAMGIHILISILNLREHWIFLADANEAGLVGPDYVMLLGASATLGLAKDNIAYAQAIVPSRINITELRPLQDGSIAFLPHGATGPLFEDILPEWTASTGWFPGTRPLFEYYWYFYDAVLAYAYAIDGLMKSEIGFANIKTGVLFKALKNTKFVGMTGNVSFDANGDNTIGLFDVSYVSATSNQIAKIYNPATGTYDDVRPIHFFGGRVDVPPAILCNDGWSGPQCSEKSNLSTGVLTTVIVVPAVAVAIALLLIFILHRRKHSTLIKEIASRQQSDIPRSEIKLHRKIGQGGAGEVYTALFRGTEVAVKRLVARRLNHSMVQEFRLESAIMCALRHPNVVLFMGSCYDQKQQEMLLIMELMSRGSLHDVLLDADIPLSFGLQLHLAYQTAQGINFLHQCNPAIIHCDIKSHNVLLDAKWSARISDFGITKLAKFQDDVDESLGTIYWAPPEVLSNQPHTAKGDCYSYGVVLWEIFHRKDPFNGKDPLVVAVDVLKRGARPAIEPHVPTEIASLMRQCWHANPDYRPTLEAVTLELRKLMTDEGEVAPIANRRVSAPTGTIFLVATEIQNANRLWDEAPAAMKEAMEMHNESMRTLLKKHRGYEVQFQDAGFLLAFAVLEEAVAWIVAMQRTLLTLNWPDELARFGCTATEQSNTGDYVWRGLRVGMAMHRGMPKCEREDYSDKVVYAGPVIKQTWKLLEHAPAGLVVISDPVAAALEKLPHSSIKEVQWEEYHKVVNPATQEAEVTHLLCLSDLTQRTLAKPGSAAPRTSFLPYSAIDIETDGATPSSGDHALKWEVPFSQLQLKDKIGKSFVADVHRASFLGTEVAVKVLHNQKLQEKDLFELKYLASSLCKIKHPNLLGFVGYSSSPVSIVLEFMPMGNLQALLHSTAPLSFAEKVRIAKETATGLLFLSETGHPKISIHRNLKSSNVLLGRNRTVKVADFALSELYDVMKTLTSVGMAAWMAPELLSGDSSHSQATTVYAFGMLMWEIYARKKPYDKIHPIKLVSEILGGRRPDIPDDCPEGYKELMKGCWHLSPTVRPTWGSIIQELSNFSVQ